MKSKGYVSIVTQAIGGCTAAAVARDAQVGKRKHLHKLLGTVRVSSQNTEIPSWRNIYLHSDLRRVLSAASL